jgi:hypothetical protein
MKEELKNKCKDLLKKVHLQKIGQEQMVADLNRDCTAEEDIDLLPRLSSNHPRTEP